MILITSAGGKTGRAMIEEFAQSEEPVRVIMRRRDLDDELSALGAAEVFHGDLANVADMSAAAAGCRAIYFICPNMVEDEGIIAQSVIAAAKSAGVERLIFHSVLHTQVQALRHHWARLFVEEAIIESGVPFSILQVGSYYQNMLPSWDKMLETGEHGMAYEVEAEMALVDLKDVSEAANCIVNDPGCVNGIFEICGPVITLVQKAAILTRVLGCKIEAKKLPADKVIAHAANIGISDFGQDCMRRMFAHYDIHGLVGSPRVLEWIIGRPPTDFETFARRITRLRAEAE